MDIDWIMIGGLLSGALAGAAARFGRLCTMSAIEDALIGGDYRGAKAWGIAVLTAIAATQSLVVAGLADVAPSRYNGALLPVGSILAGGLVFGLGMSLVGTCSFGLVVRMGGGDLRAGVTAIVVGVAAFATTAGVLEPLRQIVSRIGVFDLDVYGGAHLDGLVRNALGRGAGPAALLVCLGLLGLLIWHEPKVRRRKRLVAGALGLGLAVALGWVVTTMAVAALSTGRPESLSFVAPVGRLVLAVMGVPMGGLGFGVWATVGVLTASALVCAMRDELRWDGFDDGLEMRRHLAGGVLMGIGGVLAQGCTVGQGLSAASALALSSPLFLLGLVMGARIGLKYLIEGTALWRLGFSPRAEP